LASDNQQKQNAYSKMREEFDLSLEVVILLILGVFMLLFGLLLFRIHTGDLPYSPDSTYGLFLIIVSLQIITMGKTPFGDLRRSWMVVIIGICTAILGMYACFIPGHLTTLIRMLVGIMLFFGGISLLLQLFISEEKAKKWMKISGILQQLTIACGLVYIISAILGLITLLPGITTDPLTAVLLIIYGISFFYLSWCIQKVTGLYPPEETRKPAYEQITSVEHSSRYSFKLLRDASLSLSNAMLILTAVLLTILGLLLFQVYRGIIPFSPDGQLGLMMVLVAIKMLAIGDTPIGQYKRSWLLIIIGIAFAAMGIVSCIVPGILTGLIQILTGLLNIITGAVPIIEKFLPIRNPPAEPVTFAPITVKLMTTVTIQCIVSIALGITMLVPLVSGLVSAGILVINGLLLFVLVYFLHKKEQEGYLQFTMPGENIQ
jgi:uncharacterized membrane protein HdeD (DUF308 family)